MSLYLIGGTIAFVIGAVLWMHFKGFIDGRRAERAKSLDRGLNGLDKAMDARDGLRDPDRVERLRDKYRTR